MNAMSVANFVVNLALSENKPISNLHLQKILYYLQAFYLVRTKKPIIDSEFAREPYGPKIKEVYRNYKIYGASFITEIISYDMDIFTGEKVYYPIMNVEDLGAYQEEVLALLKNLFVRVPWSLVELTQSQKIWADYKEQIENGNAPAYSNEEILEQFTQNPENQIWNYIN